MLKTNSKQARANVIGYIRKYALDCLEERKEYSKNPVNLSNDAEMLGYIHEIFKAEKLSHGAARFYRSELDAFTDWAQGLALNQLFLYYWNRCAVDDLGAILDETEEEKARFTEDQAAEMLTRLIYRAVTDRR